MPSQTAHLAQASQTFSFPKRKSLIKKKRRGIYPLRNLEILEQFSFTTCACLDWLVVLAFYTVLHWVDAFLATLGRHPKNP